MQIQILLWFEMHTWIVALMPNSYYFFICFFFQCWSGAEAELLQHRIFLPQNRIHFAFLSLGTSMYFSKLHIILLVLFPVSKTPSCFYMNVLQFSTISKLCWNSEKYRPCKDPCGNPPTALPQHRHCALYHPRSTLIHMIYPHLYPTSFPGLG